MKKIAELTVQQFRLLNGVEYAEHKYFGPTATPSGRYFISETEINDYEGEEYAWIKDLPLIDYDPSIPDTTPPTPMGMGVMIPSDYNVLKLFPGLQFDLNGFIVPIAEVNGGYAVDLAYILWEGFRAEQDYKYNKVIFDVFSVLWSELKTAAENQEFIAL